MKVLKVDIQRDGVAVVWEDGTNAFLSFEKFRREYGRRPVGRK